MIRESNKAIKLINKIASYEEGLEALQSKIKALQRESKALSQIEFEARTELFNLINYSKVEAK